MRTHAWKVSCTKPLGWWNCASIHGLPLLVSPQYRIGSLVQSYLNLKKFIMESTFIKVP